MIETLSIERFKSIRSLTVPCSKVNVFIGPPDTGKTNVLEALYVLSRLGWRLPFDETLRIRPELGFDPLFYRQFFDRPVAIQTSRSPDEGNLRVDLEVAGADRHLEIRVNGTILRTTLAFGNETHVPELQWMRAYSYLRSEAWQYNSHRVPPLTERIIDPPHGSNLLYVARHDSRVYDLLKEVVGPNWKLRFDQAQKTFRLSEVRRDEILDYNLDLLSDSLKRFFFYASVLVTSRDAVLVFDEPDVCAFPPYPKKLGEMIAADETNQFFLTTHNPYLLTALAEKTPKHHLAIFVAGHDPDEGTGVTRLRDDQVSEVIEHGAAVFFNLDTFVAT